MRSCSCPYLAPSCWSPTWLNSHLHLLVITHSQQGHMASDGVGWIAGLQLHNGLGPLGQAREVPLVLIQLLLLILWKGAAQDQHMDTYL